MRAKLIAATAGVALAIGGVGLAQSSFASETTTQSTQSPASAQNGVATGVVHSFNIATGVGVVIMNHFLNPNLPSELQFTGSSLPGGPHGAFATGLHFGEDVRVTWITLANGANFVTRLALA
jgi:hypothetical protein